MVKAARSLEGVQSNENGALKQYEYPICEITKTGLLPPGVINTGELFIIVLGLVSRVGRRDAPFFLSGVIARSRTGLAHACGRPARHDGRSACMPLHSNLASFTCSAMLALGEPN